MVSNDQPVEDVLAQLKTIISIASSLSARLEQLQSSPGHEELDESITDDAAEYTSGDVVSPCTDCPQRATCTSPCEALKQLLPSMNAGTSRKLRTTDVSLDVLQHHHGGRIEHINFIYEQYGRCRHLLTPEQFQAIELVYRDGMLQKDAAKSLGISRAAMSGRLKRAEQILQDFQRQQRADGNATLHPRHEST